jgi:threonine dehydrogenase-like Zn-dependent dehydrogenase
MICARWRRSASPHAKRVSLPGSRSTPTTDEDAAMKAAVLHELGQSPRCEEFPAPTAQPGEVLLEVSAAPLNSIDRMIAAGSHYSKPERFPVVCGINGAGKLPDGRHVLFGGVRAPYGSMAQYAAVDPHKVFVLPAGLGDAIAAAAFNPGVSALLTLEWRAKLLPGECVLILGATGVTGQFAVQFARRMGAGRIVVAGRNRRVLAQLRELGADATIEIDQADPQLEAAFRREAGEGGLRSPSCSERSRAAKCGWTSRRCRSPRWPNTGRPTMRVDAPCSFRSELTAADGCRRQPGEEQPLQAYSARNRSTACAIGSGSSSSAVCVPLGKRTS